GGGCRKTIDFQRADVGAPPLLISRGWEGKGLEASEGFATPAHEPRGFITLAHERVERGFGEAGGGGNYRRRRATHQSNRASSDPPTSRERVARQAHRRVGGIRDGHRRYDSTHFLFAVSSA